MPRLVALGLVLASSVALADPCRTAMKRNATEDELEACLPDHATLTGKIGFGFQWNTAIGGSEQGSNGAMFASLELPVFHPLWVSLRGRSVWGSVFADTLVGWSVSHSRGPDRESQHVTETEVDDGPYTVTTTTTTYTASSSTIARRDWVVVAGARTAGILSPTDERTWHIADMLVAGVQNHFVTHQGIHRYIEAYALVNRSTGAPGVLATFHNSWSEVPDCFGFPLVFGMEAGWIPATGGSGFYWGVVDVGIGFGG